MFNWKSKLTFRVVKLVEIGHHVLVHIHVINACTPLFDIAANPDEAAGSAGNVSLVEGGQIQGGVRPVTVLRL